MIRILDKCFRIATHRDALGEDPWQDVAGYALLMNRDLVIAHPDALKDAIFDKYPPPQEV